MKFRLYSDVHQFYNDTFDVLMRDEAQNLILLGNLIIGNEGKDKTGWRDPANWLMATVSDDNDILITALMTPPHNITLYATYNIINPQAINCLIDGLKDFNIPGITSEKRLAEYFAAEYTARYGLTYKVYMDQRIYELTEVNPEVKQFGKVRLLEEKDMSFFPYWIEAFIASNVYGNTKMSIPQDASAYAYRLSTRNIYILEDNGIPVSMAGFTRRLPSAVGIAYVYTPPYFRRRGYASSCVAQLSQMVLDKGFKRCVLYTDLANPTSNSIYQKIGYRAICDSLMLSFDRCE